jgi:hypothetical protein
MGYIRHNAIIATTWQAESATKLTEYARSIGAEALAGAEMTNGYFTVCVTPDGSKEGWATSAEGDDRRALLKQWMRDNAADMFFEWCEVAYGDDDGNAEVADSAWVVANAK